MQPPLLPLNPALLPLYFKLRLILWAGLFFAVSSVGYLFLFPTITTSFDFRNPQSSKNQIFDPRLTDGSLALNGKVPSEQTLQVSTSPLGDFASLTTTITLENDSPRVEALNVSVFKNYRSFLLPIGSAVEGFPSKALFRVENTYYELIDGTLHPFVSEAAFLSRYPKGMARLESSSWRERYQIASNFLGFRIGSLISVADGIFVVTSEEEIRPIGSAEIFLALGFNFDDVIPGNEEDLGIYKRGRIMLMGALHPDGTVFHDINTDGYFLIDRGFKRPVPPGAFRDFLLERTTPLRATVPNEETAAQCRARAGLFPQTLDCTLPLDAVKQSIGSDYLVTLSGVQKPIDIASLRLSFDTAADLTNGKTLLAKVRERLLTRFRQE